MNSEIDQTNKNRIFFKGNPWPEGHPIRKFNWTAELKGSEVYFHFDLESEDYYSERDFEIDDNIEYLSDWVAPLVWGNYHRCSISANKGFRVGTLKDLRNRMEEETFKVDTDPELMHDPDELAFHIYLLGHDSIADHSIKFIKKNSGVYSIVWKGKIALTYAGYDSLDHSFEAYIDDLKMPEISEASH